jgi:hypothetical protein
MESPRTAVKEELVEKDSNRGWLDWLKFCRQKFDNSCCFQCVHRYSTGFRSGASPGRDSNPNRPRCQRMNSRFEHRSGEEHVSNARRWRSSRTI